MKRLLLLICALGAAFAGAVGASAARAATLCVGGPGCFSTLQSAVDAAQDGDTIRIGPGTFAGGVTIDKSLTLVGAGAQRTTIKGGGPVLTIFRDPDPAGLTVSIRGVTITGGVNSSKPDATVTFGGGVWIPTGQSPDPPFNTTGATVSIADSVVTGNVVRSQTEIPPGDFCGPSGLPCGFNSGGGIDNGGVLTLTDSRVSDNTAGSAPGLGTLASGVSGGGIVNRFAGTLVVKRSFVTGNHVVAAPPNGRGAASGGIDSLGALTIEDSVVANNSAELTSSFGADVETTAVAGGIRLSECCGVNATTTIRTTVIHGNRAVATGTAAGGLSISFGGGILAEASFVLERSTVTGNSVRAVSAGDAAADGGGLEIDQEATIRDTLVARNSVVVEAAGAALAQGGGIANAGQLTAERLLVLDNTVSAKGAGGSLPFGVPSAAQGGGIWNGSFGNPVPPGLTLTGSAILRNGAVASPGFLVQGGGLFTDFPVSLTRTAIAANRPDQCFGC